MSNEKLEAALKNLEMSEEQLRKISGGDCTFTDIQSGLESIQQTYDALVDFTSYVIERVGNAL